MAIDNLKGPILWLVPGKEYGLINHSTQCHDLPMSVDQYYGMPPYDNENQNSNQRSDG